MKNVIFLDFDGPLFPDRIIRFHPDNEKPYPGELNVSSPLVAGELTYWRMDPVAVGMFNILYKKYKFEFVVSSSWNRFCEIDFIRELFLINGLDIPFHKDWKTERVGMKGRRLAEIMSWLEDHPGVEGIIVEDPWSGTCVDAFEQQYSSYPVEMTDRIDRENLIIIDPMDGMSEASFNKMLLVIERWSGITREFQEERQAKNESLMRAMIW